MDLSAYYPARPAESRKGDFGRVLVAGGSERYAGAVAFNALAALRAGADVAYVVAPRRAADIVASHAPDLIAIPSDTAHPDPRIVRELLETADVLVVGGGVERSPTAHAALLKIMRDWDKPLVVDAEALHALAARPEVLQGKRVILTPHGGEFKVLTGKTWPSEMAARQALVREQAARFRAAIVVKGRYDVVSDGDRVHVDEAGSPFLTKGGYGDLLAGAAGALLARGAPPFDAACGAAWIVGSAGARAAAALGESTLASDALARFAEVVPRGGAGVG